MRPDTPEPIEDAAARIRADATLVVDRHVNPSQKAASLALYAVLASCMGLCERCEDPTERARMEALFKAQPVTGNRRYVEKGSDVFVFVCRYVFTETDRANAMRYASALREAARLRIGSDTLGDYLKHKGGVNALYFRRPIAHRKFTTKTLRLAQPVEISRDEPFTLTLRWRDDNCFDVV